MNGSAGVIFEELLLALPPPHPLIRMRTVSAADLAHERSSSCRKATVSAIKFGDFATGTPCITKISFRSAQLETIQSLGCARLGISLIPAMAAHRDRKNAQSSASCIRRNPTVKLSPSGLNNVRPDVQRINF